MAVFCRDVDSVSDIHGNVNTEGFAWEVTLTAVAEYFYDNLLPGTGIYPTGS